MRSRRALGIAVFFCICAAAYQPAEAGRSFRQALQFFQERKLKEARTAAVQALAADPRMGDAEILLGLIATAQSQLAEAEQRFARAVHLQPQNHQAHAYLGATYLALKRLPEAAATFRKVLELNPANVMANYNLGLIALQQSEPADALRRFELVTRASASDAAAWIGILESQLLLHRAREALQSAQLLQALLEDRDARLFQVASLLAAHGESAAAVPILERVRRVFPESYDVNYNLALACFHTNQYDRAAGILGELAGARGKAEAFDLLGAVEEKRAHVAEAERAFAEAAHREPANEDYRFDYGNALVREGKLEPAMAAFRAAVAELPNSWKLRIGLGSACYLAGDYESAAQTLLDVIRLKPDSGPAYFLLGEAYDSAGRFQPAIEKAFDAYLKGAPPDAWAFCHYAAMLYARMQAERRDEFQEAVENLNAALRLKPDFAEAYFQMGLIALAEGKTEQSIRALEKATHLDPQLGAAHYRLGLAYQRLGNAARAREELDRFRALKDEGRSRERVLESLAAIVR
jgi:tetratricopeptide (TPR) repeat protein